MASKDTAERRRQAKLDRQSRTIAHKHQLELQLEISAERLAPHHVRHPVTDKDGRVVRGALVIVDGCTIRRASVVDRLRSYGLAREKAGKATMITERRAVAADRLALDHAEVGAGIGVCASDYLRLSGTHGGGNGHGSILAQIAARARLDGAMAWLGSFVDIVAPVVLDGVDVKAWAESRGLDREQSIGYLGAALERLAEFYDTPKVKAGNAGGMRNATFGQSAAVKAPYREIA